MRTPTCVRVGACFFLGVCVCVSSCRTSCCTSARALLLEHSRLAGTLCPSLSRDAVPLTLSCAPHSLARLAGTLCPSLPKWCRVQARCKSPRCCSPHSSAPLTPPLLPLLLSPQANAKRVELSAVDANSPVMLKPVPVKGEAGGAASAKYELPDSSCALGSTSPPRAIARYLEATMGYAPRQHTIRCMSKHCHACHAGGTGTHAGSMLSDA